MHSILRFLIFVALVALVVSGIYFWRLTTQPERPAEASPTRLVQEPLPTPALPAESSPSAPLSLPSLEAWDREFTQLVSKVLPSVVSIMAVPPPTTANRRTHVMQRFFGGAPIIQPPPQMGSGVIVSEDGFILTNDHVVQGARDIEVHLSDGRKISAQFIGSDPLSDIAILKIDADGLIPLVFGDSDEVKVGQMVFAIGNPFGLQETVTQGIISATGRRLSSETVREFFQTNADINPGNSGGPLVNLRGEIIGINNFIVSSTGGSQGIGFAIPSNTAKRVYESFRTLGRVARPWFGVYMRQLSPQLIRQLQLPQETGALVEAVADGSPAEAAGLVPGDLIVEFNGKPVRDTRELRLRVTDTAVGQNVALKVVRRGTPVELETVMTEGTRRSWSLPVDMQAGQN